MKTPKELSALKQELELLSKKLAELTEEELNQIAGGRSTPPFDPLAGAHDAILERAVLVLGTPYQWGAVGPEGYDCSGLVSYCITGVHARIGTTSTFMGWPRVSNPMPGDICTNSNHCGIYVSPSTMIHAPTFGQCVKYDNIMSDMIIVRPPDLP